MKNKEIVLYLAYLILALSVYSPAFDNSFRTDDFVFLRHVTTNPAPAGIIEPSAAFAFYRPGAVALFYAEYGLFGFEGGRYIAFNFLLHVAISLFAMAVLVTLGLSRHVVLLAGSLFVLGFGHYGKQVMWASTSGPLFAVVITLITIMITLRWMDAVVTAGGRGLRSDRAAYPLSVLLLLLVCPLFHEISLFTPILLAVIVWLHLREHSIAVRSRILLVLSPTLAWLVILTLLAQTYASYQRITDVLFRIPETLLRYAGFMLFPVQPSGVADAVPAPLRHVVGAAGYVHLVLGAGVVAALVALWVRGGRTRRFLAAWLAIAVVPVCFVEVPEGWLELRYLYYASIPLCAMAADLLVELARRRARLLRIATLFVLIAVTGGTSVLVTLLERQYDRQSREPKNTERFEHLRSGGQPIDQPVGPTGER